MKIYRPEFTEQDVNTIVNLFNIAVRTNGMVDNIDIAARAILNKIGQAEVKPPDSEDKQ